MCQEYQNELQRAMFSDLFSILEDTATDNEGDYDLLVDAIKIWLATRPFFIRWPDRDKSQSTTRSPGCTGQDSLSTIHIGNIQARGWDLDRHLSNPHAWVFPV